MISLSFKGRTGESQVQKQNKKQERGYQMKSFGAKVMMGGQGTVPSKNYKPRGLRNKRRSHWAYERKVAQMLKENREKELLRQQENFENFDD